MSFRISILVALFLTVANPLSGQQNKIDIAGQSIYISSRIQLTHHSGTACTNLLSLDRGNSGKQLPGDFRSIDSDFILDPSAKRLAYILSLGESSVVSVSLRVVTVPDGKSVVVHKGTLRREGDIQDSVPQRNYYWSPDGQHLLYTTAISEQANPEPLSSCSTHIYSVGQGRTKCVDADAQWTDIVWQDPSKLIFRRVTASVRSGTEEKCTVCSYDLNSGTRQSLCKFEGRPLATDKQSGSVLLESSDDASLWSVSLSGGEPLKLGVDESQQMLKRVGLQSSDLLSKDGVWQVVSEQPDITVSTLQGNERTNITENRRSRFLSWSPATSWLLFLRTDKVLDDSGEIGEKHTSLWATPVPNIDREKPGKPKELLVCADIDEQPEPMWSADGSRIIYSSGSDIYMAAISSEKTSETVDPAVDSVLKAGKDIAEAFRKYLIHNQKAFPPMDNFAAELTPYLSDVNSLRRPDKEDFSSFVYLHPYRSQDEINEPGQVIIGYLDYGLGWRLNIYADGHTDFASL